MNGWGGIASMKIRRDHEYAHSTDVVFALFTDRKEIKAKQKALGARNIKVEACEADADSATVSFVRELPAEVPGVLKKFLQPWNTVAQSEEWRRLDDDQYAANLSIDIANVPVTITGTLKLEPLEDGCVNHVRLDVDCGIPFVGKTLVEFVAADCKRLIRNEYEYLRGRLSD